jgi:acyl-CoA thioester hydrolase
VKKEQTTPPELYRSPYTVTTGDINYGGHLGNERALLIFQDARLRFLSSLKLSEMDLGEKTALIVVEAVCRFQREVFLHEELEVLLQLLERAEKKVVFGYSVIRTNDGAEVITGQTTHLGFTYSQRKVVPLPKSFLTET